ncbi:hypothetical protein ACFL27_09900, partial [candidate division CSSED10-310 bacterium]
ESGSENCLKAIAKEQLTRSKIIDFALQCKKYAIVPEFSFMLGTGDAHLQEFEETVSLIRKIKTVNEQSIIVLYLFSPVALTPHANRLLNGGFMFPDHLAAWESSPWSYFDRRRGAYSPWLPQKLIHRLHNFEVVLNARFPAVSDIHLPVWARKILSVVAAPRYQFQLYQFPLELKIFLRLASYIRPEERGL